MATDKLKKLFKGKDSKAEELKEAKAIKAGKITPEEYAKGEEMEKKMCGGGKAKKYAAGGVTKDMPEGKKMGSLGLKKGGMARMANKGEHSVQTKSKRGAEVVKMAKGGFVKSADGVASKGKTKGKFI